MTSSSARAGEDIRTLDSRAAQASTANGERPAIVEARGVGVSFKGLRALNDVDVCVGEGQVFGLLGPNGAGKSTLLGVLSGLRRPDVGTVCIAGVDVSGEPPHKRAVRGVARTFQHPQVFADLTVREHMRLAYRLHHQRRRLWTDLIDGAGLREPSADESAVVAELIEVLELTQVADRAVVGLPLGTTRLVEVGQALATRPRVILLDEPSSGLDPHETQRLVSALTDVVSAQGVSLLLVEHDVELVMGISHVIQVLEFGQTIAVGEPAEVRANAAVRSAYLGDQLEVAGEVPPRHRTLVADRAADQADSAADQRVEAALTLEGVSAKYGEALALDNVSMQVGHGSVLALLGANGAGKSTLGRVLSGLIPASSGTITFEGNDITRTSADETRRLGVAYLPEGRGVFPTLSVVDNLKLAVRMLPKEQRQGAVDGAMDMFPIFRSRRRQLAGQMSGGEQQMLSLARALAVRPRLVIADEMSLGLAPKIVDQVYDALHDALDEGISLIIIEQLVHKALGMADHCCILRRGQVAWQGAAASAADDLLEHYLGSSSQDDDVSDEARG